MMSYMEMMSYMWPIIHYHLTFTSRDLFISQSRLLPPVPEAKRKTFLNLDLNPSGARLV